MSDKPELPLLHVLPQHQWHDEVVIVGNMAGLLKLKAALDDAISRGENVSRSVFCTDGEGYRVIVIPATNDQMEEVPYGYTDPIARDKGQDMPYWLAQTIMQNYTAKR